MSGRAAATRRGGAARGLAAAALACVVVGAGLVVGLVGASGCGSREDGPRWRAAGATSPQRGGSLRFATTDAVLTLDPAIAYDEVSFYIEQHLFDTLVGYPPAGETSPPAAAANPALQLVPQLAESWQLSDDGLHLSFTLRPNLRYHDGTPIVAGDFKYALERVLTTADSPFRGFLGSLAGAAELIEGKATECSGLRAPDDRHFEITLVKRDPTFLYILAMKLAAPQRKEHVERAGGQLRRQPLASGPYMLASWKEGQRLVMVRNPHHWDAQRGFLDEISMLENVPHDVEFLMFERGELDTCFQPAAPDHLWLHQQTRWLPFIRRVTLMNVFGERMNVTRPPFNDVRVRRALNYAFDKRHTTKLLFGTATAAHGILPPGMMGRDEALEPYPYDPARARALLAEAGYPDGFEVEYVTIPNDEPRKLAASLQADLAKVGVRLKIKVLSFTAYLSSVNTEKGPAFSFTSWTQDYPDPGNFIDARFHSSMISPEASVNDSFFTDPAVDALIDQARAETDREKRAALYRQLDRMLHEAAPWIWGYHRVATEVVQPYLRGYSPHPVWLRDYSASWLDVDADGKRVAWDAPARTATVPAPAAAPGGGSR